MDFEGFAVFGEHAEVLLGDAFADGILLTGVDQGDAGAFEAGTTEAATIDALGLTHDVVDGYQFFATALVVLDAAFATLKTELAKEVEVTGLPSGDALADTLVLAVIVLGTAGKAGRHFLLGEVVGLFGNIAQVGLVETLEGHAGVGHHVPGCGLALGHTEVVVAVNKATGEAAEDDSEFELGHTGVLADDAVLLGVGIEEEQGILFAKGDTGLVEDTVGETNVFAFGLTGNLDDLHGGEVDAVGFGKGHDISYQYGRTGGETADGQAALDYSLDTFGELEALLQGKLGTAGVVAPIAFLDTGGLLDIEFYRTLEGKAMQENAAVFGGGEQQIDTFVESKTGDKTVLVIDMGTQWANTVRGKDVVLGLFSEEIQETFVHDL